MQKTCTASKTLSLSSGTMLSLPWATNALLFQLISGAVTTCLLAEELQGCIPDLSMNYTLAHNCNVNGTHDFTSHVSSSPLSISSPPMNAMITPTTGYGNDFDSSTASSNGNTKHPGKSFVVFLSIAAGLGLLWLLAFSALCLLRNQIPVHIPQVERSLALPRRLSVVMQLEQEMPVGLPEDIVNKFDVFEWIDNQSEADCPNVHSQPAVPDVEHGNVANNIVSFEDIEAGISRLESRQGLQQSLDATTSIAMAGSEGSSIFEVNRDGTSILVTDVVETVKYLNPDICLFCWERFKRGDRLMALPCHYSHRAHEAEFRTWFRVNSTCPNCRHEYFPNKNQDTLLNEAQTAQEDAVESAPVGD